MNSNIKDQFKKVIYGTFRKLPIRKNKVLFLSYYGEQYSGSPKYISKYLEENSDLEVVWAFTKKEEHKAYRGNSVRYARLGYYYALATAGTIITNYRMTEEFVKRKGQTYIQTWHSSLRMKMIEKDAESTLPVHYVKMAKRDSEQIDYLLAGSEKSADIFRKSFWYSGEIEKTGTPQCDILFEDRTPYQQLVRNYYHIPEDGKIALYAPTFRKGNDLSAYDLNTEELLSALTERFGGNWYLLMRLHPHLSGMTDIFHYSDRVLQATDYDDVQELLCASDILFSDYSAISFDFSETHRPCFLYTPDVEEYTAKDRKLYFSFDELPFEHFTSQAQMLEAIKAFSENDYEEKITAFLSKIGSYNDGLAGKRVFELIRKEHR